MRKTSRGFNEIKWTFSSEKFSRKQEAERIRWDTPLITNAVALGASKFILLTDVAGVYRDYHGDRELVSELRADEARAMIRDGSISRGMIPKVEACLAALGGGVPSAHIVDGTAPHGLLVELFTERGVGTMLVP